MIVGFVSYFTLPNQRQHLLFWDGEIYFYDSFSLQATLPFIVSNYTFCLTIKLILTVHLKNYQRLLHYQARLSESGSVSGSMTECVRKMSADLLEASQLV